MTRLQRLQARRFVCVVLSLGAFIVAKARSWPTDELVFWGVIALFTTIMWRTEP